PAEHLHLARLDLGGVAGLTLLVLPLPRLERPLDVDLPALLEVLRADLGEAVPRDHAVPLRLLDEVAVAVLVGLVRGDVEVAHGRAAAGVAQLGVGAEVADEDDLVNSAACHSWPPVLLDLVWYMNPPVRRPSGGAAASAGCPGCQYRHRREVGSNLGDQNKSGPVPSACHTRPAPAPAIFPAHQPRPPWTPPASASPTRTAPPPTPSATPTSPPSSAASAASAPGTASRPTTPSSTSPSRRPSSSSTPSTR